MAHRRHLKKKERYLKPLSNYDILNWASEMKIPYFKGVFMRDELLKKQRPAIRECWILNHASSHTDGSHWCALVKIYNKAYYFDSFGKLPPPLEVLRYLGGNIELYYNTKRYQNYGTTICGHLCLKFLHDFWENRKKIRG